MLINVATTTAGPETLRYLTVRVDFLLVTAVHVAGFYDQWEAYNTRSIQFNK